MDKKTFRNAIYTNLQGQLAKSLQVLDHSEDSSRLFFIQNHFRPSDFGEERLVQYSTYDSNIDKNNPYMKAMLDNTCSIYVGLGLMNHVNTSVFWDYTQADGVQIQSDIRIYLDSDRYHYMGLTPNNTVVSTNIFSYKDTFSILGFQGDYTRQAPGKQMMNHTLLRSGLLEDYMASEVFDPYELSYETLSDFYTMENQEPDLLEFIN